MNCLVMEYLPGRPLRYETDLPAAAEIFADIHALDIPADCRMLEPKNPLEAIIEECGQMVSHYYSWDQADPAVTHLLETLEKEISSKDLSAPQEIRKCMVNTRESGSAGICFWTRVFSRNCPLWRTTNSPAG